MSASHVPLLAAASDPKLLGATLTLRPRQRDLLASLDGVERLYVWAIGRQAGKSTLGAMAAVHNATMRPDLDAMLPRGRTRYVLAAAPGQDQASEFVRLCEGLIEASPLLAPLATVRADRIDFALPSGAKTAIRAMPANSRSVRGLSASMVVLDEFAHFADTAGPASDERMWAALEPSTRVFGDLARVLVISTPFGESGKFFELFNAAASGLMPSARAVHAPVWGIDPSLGEAWRDAKRRELGEDIFRQEHGAEFVAGGGSFFDLRGIPLEAGPARPEDCGRWVAGLDPAFHGDRFGVAVVGVSRAEPGVLLVGRVEALEPGSRLRSLELRRGREDRTLGRVWEVLEPYRPRVVTDQHQADAVSSYFGRLGVSVRVVNLTGPVQTAAFVSTRARLLDGSLRLWRQAQLLEELRRVRARDSESIELPRFAGGHCDAASALALAVHELRRGGTMTISAATDRLLPVGGANPRKSVGQVVNDLSIARGGEGLQVPERAPAWVRAARAGRRRPPGPGWVEVGPGHWQREIK